MEKKIHSVKYNFIMNFILTASNLVFPIITFPYVARVLSVANNGKVSFVTSVANYFIMVASLGIPTYGVRACAVVREDKDKLTKTVQELCIINAIMTVFVTITFILSVYFVPQFREEKTLFLINAVSVALNFIGMNWVYQALEQYDYITIRSVLFKVISIILMFVFVHKAEDYPIYGAILVLALVGSNILNFIRLRKYIDFKPRKDYNFKQHFKPILILFSQAVAVSIYTNLDIIMLRFMKTNVDVGYYNAAVKIKIMLLGLVTSFGNVLLPRMSYYAKNKQMDNFKKYMIKALNLELLMAIAFVVYFVLYAKEATLFIAGPEYGEAVLAMRIITTTIIPIGITGILGIQVLTALEKEKYVLISVVAGAVTDLLLNLVYIPMYGAAGAALATTIAEFVVLLVQVIYTRDLLSEMSSQYRIHYYILLGLVSAVPSFFVRFIGFKSEFLLLAVSALVYFFVYGLGLLLLKEEVLIDVLKDIMRKVKEVKKTN